jgi:branched-chain amino acid transport system substrate-binding protein
MLVKRCLLLVMSLSLLLVLLAACGGGGEEKTPTATYTSTTTATAVPTPTATATAVPTPTATATPTATSTPTPGGPVKIGVVHDWSGAWAISGTYYADHLIKLVEKQVKDQGGILGGREVNLLKYDGGSTVAGIQTAAQKAYYDGMSVLTEGGTASVNGQVVSDLAEKNQILFTDLIILPYDVSNLKFTIRAGYRLDEMTLESDYAIKVLKAKNVAILGRDLEESRHFADLWEAAVKASGGKIVYKDFPPLGTVDMSAYLTKVKYYNPDVLITDLEEPAYATMAAQIVGLGGWGDTKVIANMAATLVASKRGAEGWYVYARWLPGMDNPGSKKFEQDYQAMYGSEPDSAMELMYEPLWLAIKAIELAGTDADRVAIAQAARSGNLAWETPLGYISWGTDGNPETKVRLLAHVENGKMVPVPAWE